MIPVRLRILDPTDARHLSGSMTFTPRSAIPGRTVTDDGALVSGKPIPVEVEGDDTIIPLRHTEPGWHYQVNGSDESGYRWTEAVYVPSRLDYGQESIDYGDLVRADPKALTAFTPDPEWWRITRELIRIIEGAGGVPGEPAKAAVERVLERSLTDTEFMEAIRGPRGIGGDNGVDGLTYLDWFRLQVGNPTATDAQYHEYIRGRTALEQWAQFVGEDTSDVEVSDMFSWLAGDDAYSMWKQAYGQPDATLDDFYEFFRGPKGKDSTARGPQGDPGRDVYDLVVASGYEGTEEDFAGAVLGTTTPYEQVTLINGWTHTADELRLKVQDGTVHLTGAINVGDSNAPFVQLPLEARPIDNMMRYAGNQSTARDLVRLYFFADSGDVQVHGSYLNALSQTLFIDLMWAARNQVTRPRIPGPRGLPGEAGEDGEHGVDGKSAYDFAVEDGYEGDQEHFAGMLNEIGKYTPAQLQEFIDRNELTRGPAGPRGYQGMQGVPGERGRGVYELVRDSGYTGSEEDFAGSLLGDVAQWQECILQGGWQRSGQQPLSAKLVDGNLHISGRVLGSGDPSGVIARLPNGMRPTSTLSWINGRSVNANIRGILHDNGNINIHSADQSATGSQISFDATVPGVGETRPRIPGPSGRDGVIGRDGEDGGPGADGKSAYDYARDTGWTGSEAHLAEMFGAIARYTPAQLQEFIEEADRAEGPPGRPGEDASPYRAILALARLDGWTAVYDPTNPNTRVLNAQGRVTSIADGLSNMPPLVSDGNPPQHHETVFGDVDGITGGTLTTTFPAPLPQPTTAIAVASNKSGPTGGSRWIFGNDDANTRTGILVNPAGNLQHFTGWLRGGTTAARGQHIYDARFDSIRSTLNEDGQYSDYGHPADRTNTMGGLRVGSRNGTTQQWIGDIGPILIYAGGAPHAALTRMRNLLHRLTDITPAMPRFGDEVQVYSVDQDGLETVVHGDPDLPLQESAASLSKMTTTLVARQYLDTDAKLDETCTVQSGDSYFDDFQNRFQAGDVVSYRDLIHAMAMPSDNDAPMIMAREIGERFLQTPGTGLPPVERFVRKVNEVLTQEWGYESAHARNPAALSNYSPRQVAGIMRRIASDPALREAYGKMSHNLVITGPNARQVPIQHTVQTGATFPLQGVVAAKTGSMPSRVHLAWVWQHPDGTEHTTVVMNAYRNPTNRRFPESYKAVQAVLSGRRWRHAEWQQPHGDRDPTTFVRDITDELPGVTRTTAGSGVYLSRDGQSAQLMINYVRMPAGFSISSYLPTGFRPQMDQFPTISADNGANFRLCRIASNGAIEMRGNTATEVLRGTCTWSARSDRTFPAAPFPGIATR